MSERLNTPLIKDFLEKNLKTREWLAVKLGISGSLLNQMMIGRVPKTATMQKLSKLMNTPAQMLVIPQNIKAD